MQCFKCGKTATPEDALVGRCGKQACHIACLSPDLRAAFLARLEKMAR